MFPTTLDKFLYRVWQAFSANWGSLRLFGEQISQVADRLDRQTVKEIAQVFADVFGDTPEQVEEELLEFFPSLDELDIYPTSADRADVREVMQVFENQRFKQRVLEWLLENPRKSHKFLQAWTDYLAQPPANGILLRRSALVSLVGTLEILLEALFFGYYFYVDSSSRTSDMTAREQTARKQAEKAMHSGGWRGRIEKFTELGVDLKGIGDYLDQVVEITQRRNLIVHNEGVIDARYMRNSPPEYRPAGAKEGVMLIVSTRYLNRAFDVVMLLAFALSQACWRQWQPKKSKRQANRVVENLIYQTLRFKRYILVQDLARLAYELPLPRRTRQLVLVNHAIALRDLGEKTAMGPLLSELKKKKRDWRVTIALAILQEDFRKAHWLMKRAVDKGKFREISPYWPLFNPVRNESWFKNLCGTPERGTVPKKRS